MFKTIFVIAVVFSAVACSIHADGPGGSVNSGNNGESQTYSYSFEYNGCKTGVKEFSNMTDYCNTLKDDAANNNCARNMRYDEFKQKCAGQSWN